jgi:hypothetical protein
MNDSLFKPAFLAVMLSCGVVGDAAAGLMAPTTLTIAGFTGGPDPGTSIESPRGIQVQDGYAYVTDEGLGALDVIDIHNPGSPVLVTSDTGVCNGAKGIAVQGQYAFLGCGSDNAVKIFNISNPVSPSLVATIPGPVPGTTLKDVWTVQVNGNHLYALSGNSLAIVDISNPASPVFVSNTILPSGGDIPRDIAFRGNDAFILTNNGLYIYDISNPADPIALGSTQGPVPGTTLEQARSIQLVGNYALVAVNLQQAVATIDISNPADPTYIGSFDGPDPGTTFDGITDIWVSGDVAYTANDVAYTVSVLDISDPTDISWIDDVPRSTTDLAGVQQFASDGGDLFYITHDDGGVGALAGNGEFDLPFPQPELVSDVSEPTTLALFGTSLLCLFAFAAQKRSRINRGT